VSELIEMKKNRPARTERQPGFQCVRGLSRRYLQRLKFLRRSWITLCPEGTPDISRWRNHRMRSETLAQPRRGDRPGLVCRPSGAGNRSIHWPRWLRCAPPPANIRCASGAKTCAETLAEQFAPRLLKRFLTAANRVIVLILIAAFCAATARAQDARLQIDHLKKLADKAAEVVEVTLDERSLRLAARFLSANNPGEAKVKEIVSSLTGVYVRVFEFDKPGEYSSNDLEPIRAQLRQPGWDKIVGVTSRRGGSNVDVHLKYQGDNIIGVAIVSADPTELTVVNIIGPIDLEKVRQLEGQFGIPKLDLGEGGKVKPRNK